MRINDEHAALARAVGEDVLPDQAFQEFGLASARAAADVQVRAAGFARKDDLSLPADHLSEFEVVALDVRHHHMLPCAIFLTALRCDRCFPSETAQPSQYGYHKCSSD